MIKAVLDTNILISALIKPSGAPAKVFDHVLNGNVLICFDSNIISEYKDVLERSKFNFDQAATKQVLDFIIQTGMSIIPEPLSIDFQYDDDKIFYEAASFADCYLVTDNARHFPEVPFVVSATEFLRIIESHK